MKIDFNIADIVEWTKEWLIEAQEELTANITGKELRVKEREITRSFKRMSKSIKKHYLHYMSNKLRILKKENYFKVIFKYLDK